MIDWPDHFIDPPHPDFEEIEEVVGEIVYDESFDFDPTNMDVRAPIWFYRYGYTASAAVYFEEPFICRFLIPELDNHALAVRSRMRAYWSDCRGWFGEWRDEWVPDGWRTLREDEHAKWGDARLCWGGWVSVDCTKTYGSTTARPSTFEGPIIRPATVQVRCDVAEQEELL